MRKQNLPGANPLLQQLKPFILVFAVLMIGAASVCCLVLTVVAAMSPRPYLAMLSGSGFIATLKMAYDLACRLIS